jgi:hypothetical protein
VADQLLGVLKTLKAGGDGEVPRMVGVAANRSGIGVLDDQ